MQSKNQNIKVDRTLVQGFADTQKKYSDIPTGAVFSDGAESVARKAVNFLEKVGQAQENVQDVRKKNFQDDTRTIEKQRLDTSNYADQKGKEINSKYESLKPPAEAAQVIRDRIRDHKREQANSQWGREARDVVRGMDKGDRVKYVTDLIRNGEDKMAAQILGAPSGAHVGMDKDTFNNLNSRFNETFLADDMQVINNLKKLDQNISRARKEFSGFRRDLATGLDKTIANAKAAQEAMNQ